MIASSVKVRDESSCVYVWTTAGMNQSVDGKTPCRGVSINIWQSSWKAGGPSLCGLSHDKGDLALLSLRREVLGGLKVSELRQIGPAGLPDGSSLLVTLGFLDPEGGGAMMGELKWI